MKPMKKFKTSAEKRQLEDSRLRQLLAERSLLRTAFVNYTCLPLGLILTGLMLLISWLSGRPLTALENGLFVFFGIGLIAFFYMLQAYAAFASHRRQLAHVRNSFVGSRVLPILCGGLLLYMAVPLGLPVLSLTAGLLLLALLHLTGKLTGRPGHLLAAVYMSAMLGIPLLAPQGAPDLNALAAIVIALVILTGVALRSPASLLLNVDAQGGTN